MGQNLTMLKVEINRLHLNVKKMMKIIGCLRGSKYGFRGQVVDMSWGKAFLSPTSFPFLNICYLQFVVDRAIFAGKKPKKDWFDSS